MQAFELATTTEWLQVGGGYRVLSICLTAHPPSSNCLILPGSKWHLMCHVQTIILSL